MSKTTLTQKRKSLAFNQIISSILNIILFPIWIIEALYILKTIPRVPGPKDATEGIIENKNAKESVRVLIIGESTVSGDGLKSFKQTMGYQFCEKLSQLPDFKPFNIKWKIIGKSGYTIKKLKKRYIPQINAKDFDIIMLQDSANDCLRFTNATEFKKETMEVIYTLMQQNPDVDIYIPCPPDFTIFPSIPWPLNRVFGYRGKVIALVQEIIGEEINLETKKHDKYTGKVLVTPYGQFHPGRHFFGIDSFHPSAKGAIKWAEDEVKKAQLPLKFRL